MSVLWPLRKLVSSRRRRVDVVECRRCGTSLDDDGPCPCCGSDDIATFEF